MVESFLGGKVELHGGDCRDVIRTLADSSVDSVVTDPPYALVSIVKRFGGEGAAPAKGGVYERSARGFMGKQWDNGEAAFAVEFWAEVYRVLRPGGHVVAFGGTRTFHRLACAIDDAGFEIRDQLAWMYGSGFPKSHDVSKGIDKAAGVEFTASPASGVGFMGPDGPGGYNVTKNQLSRKGESTADAREWVGWGTALKPSFEPVCLARKPLIGTVAANVLAHGVGALNIDATRIPTDWESERGETWLRSGNNSEPMQDNSYMGRNGPGSGSCADRVSPLGRWPANLVHDGSDEVVGLFPETGASSGGTYTRAASDSIGTFKTGERSTTSPADNGGSAARFFYTAKADAEDRLGSKHPTVKPVDLLQWLIRLVCPRGGLVLDPFAGTGTTGEAAWREGMRCILIEREAEYQADIARRMSLADCGPDARLHGRLKAAGKVEAASSLPLFAEAAE